MFLCIELGTLCMLPRYFFLQPLNALGTQEQERELEEVLERLKIQVRTRRLMLYPYFRDFDRVSSIVLSMH